MANDDERQRVADFIDSLYELGGFNSWGEFARESGLLASTISDYKRGENAPSGPNLLRLIEAATARTPLAMREAAARRSPSAQILSRLAALEVKADQALTGIADVLDLLRGAPSESSADAPTVSQ